MSLKSRIATTVFFLGAVFFAGTGTALADDIHWPPAHSTHTDDIHWP
ncbi:hypothetical protein [Kutzneria chonburiensis]|uniref:Uncharacterized protein n=1 Tax=Kutzneria chonburiensis TaxID=1483604 RepID=A0ABV6N6E7_9PSEU|nr:hypothetical protein [Kutzneria chonburiensis]